MRPSIKLLQATCRITLFTRPNCSLCTDAKSVLLNVQQKRSLQLDELHIMEPGPLTKQWRDLYEFDTPVIHVDAIDEGDKKFQTTAAALKLMHRFKESEVEALMDEVIAARPQKA
ncbi:hypothetical protein K402DRAFT_339331 [Aulographum hederae CBS 113979]|uniref:Glutaredoxin-like protein n=1 Tax=Aulographum hederae CBS 113979 TaxID=1176131 RepID=A0A6G1GQ00_9PEZI|nr:hypothetical protein K402DRAFT_339331 [Aulographum hederae CBS 113979]